MMKRHALTLTLLLCLTPFAVAMAQGGPPPAKPIDAVARRAVIAELGTQLQANYVYPDIATQVAVSLKAKEASGGYATASDTDAFAKALAKDLSSLGKDLHFDVAYDPEFRPRPAGQDLPSAAEIEQDRKAVARYGYGLGRVQRLPGNVGYLEVRGFGPTEAVAEALSAAITVLSGTDALILDLRRNGGGQPTTVAYLLSHFFPLGDERHLNDLYNRPEDTTRQYWTSAAVMPRYTRPIYVLTSARTFSGGEECAYDLQTQKRATLVGETTGGGANPGDMVPIGHGFIAFIPTGKAINPITKTSWEHVGVKPDIAVPAAEAQKTAHAAILKDLIAAAKDSDEKAELQETLAKVEAGREDPPVYTPRPR